jgi:hypothetical protein
MMDAIGNILSDLEVPKMGRMGKIRMMQRHSRAHSPHSEDNESSWVRGTNTKTVQQHMERFHQQQMRLDKLTQPGWEDTAAYFH